jgi:hypothetical protein
MVPPTRTAAVRTIVNACADHPNLDGAALSGYITEPLAAITHASEAPDEAIARTESAHYFTSPGGVSERVSAYLVEVAPSTGLCWGDLPALLCSGATPRGGRTAETAMALGPVGRVWYGRLSESRAALSSG